MVAIKGNDLLALIPQRNPMVMVDELSVISRHSAQTVLHVRPDNMFVYKNGELAETGLIEHIAQSAAALAGYNSLAQGKALIGEVKRFDCHRRPAIGDAVTTAVTFGFTYGNTSIVSGISSVDGEVVAKIQLKLFIQ